MIAIHAYRHISLICVLVASDAIAQTNPEESKIRVEHAAQIIKKLAAKRNLEKAEITQSRSYSAKTHLT